jgi:hypothetical protein
MTLQLVLAVAVTAVVGFAFGYRSGRLRRRVTAVVSRVVVAAACKRPGQGLKRGDMVTLGLDGSVRGDALVACRVSDGHLELIGLWEKPEGPESEDWQVDTESVDAALATAEGDELGRLVAATEGPDGAMACPLFQHTCGHVQGLSLMESSAHGYDVKTDRFGEFPATGAVCGGCGDHAHSPGGWRLLWRAGGESVRTARPDG